MIVSRMLSRLVSIPPVTSSISMMSIPANLPIPIIRPVSAMHAELISYFSFNESTTGTSPAPRGMTMFAGGSPSSILLRLTGWSFTISYVFTTSLLRMSAVFAASGVPSNATTSLGLFPSTLGSASLTLSERPSPLSTSTAL